MPLVGIRAFWKPFIRNSWALGVKRCCQGHSAHFQVCETLYKLLGELRLPDSRQWWGGGGQESKGWHVPESISCLPTAGFISVSSVTPWDLSRMCCCKRGYGFWKWVYIALNQEAELNRNPWSLESWNGEKEWRLCPSSELIFAFIGKPRVRLRAEHTAEKQWRKEVHRTVREANGLKVG